MRCLRRWLFIELDAKQKVRRIQDGAHGQFHSGFWPIPFKVSEVNKSCQLVEFFKSEWAPPGLGAKGLERCSSTVLIVQIVEFAR